MNLTVKVTGIDELLKRFDKLTGDAILSEMDKVTETYTRNMANESAALAPKRDLGLTNSIVASPAPAEGEKGIWTYGSDKPYARRQEYEHATQKGFFRQSVWNNREGYREAIRRKIAEGAKK